MDITPDHTELLSEREGLCALYGMKFIIMRQGYTDASTSTTRGSST